jgi:prepilin-type N-terminal cleavage/methylation domain-containing protein
MKFASIGTLAASPSSRNHGSGEGQAGFTLLEALVALALLLAFAGVIGPQLSLARRIMAHAESRVAAQVLLRTLIDAPFERSTLATATREGESGGLRWSIVTQPIAAVATGAANRSNWLTFRLIASVAWAPDQMVTAETMRLGKAEQ